MAVVSVHCWGSCKRRVKELVGMSRLKLDCVRVSYAESASELPLTFSLGGETKTMNAQVIQAGTCPRSCRI